MTGFPHLAHYAPVMLTLDGFEPIALPSFYYIVKSQKFPVSEPENVTIMIWWFLLFLLFVRVSFS